MTDIEECAKRVGTTLRDKWTLERMLGVGGMAAVYVGVHKIGRRDAIKILHADIASSPEVRARFEQEAQAVNRFKHPGAVEIRDIDVTEDGAPFLVMELLEGETLSRIARREPAPTVDDVLRWADEILDVLAAAHAQGIVHRDIKPDNLFVLKDGRLKVLDFGIARVRSGAAKMLKTATGATIGTVSYMPPEQAKGGDIDARTDIFAVGATMFRLLAKRKVHEAENDIELLKKMATLPAPRLVTVCPSVAEAVCRIVDRALEFDRDARYPNAAAMQADVRAARSHRAIAPETSAAPPSAPSPLAMSIETPPSAVPPPPASDATSSSEALTVGPRRQPASPTEVDPEPPAMSVPAPEPGEAMPTGLPTRADVTLRSGPRAPDLIKPTAISPVAAAGAGAPTPLAGRWKLWLVAGGAIAFGFGLVVAIGIAVLFVKTVPAGDVDAATSADAADPLDAAFTEDLPPASAVPATSATHKPAPPKPTAPTAPSKHPHGH